MKKPPQRPDPPAQQIEDPPGITRRDLLVGFGATAILSGVGLWSITEIIRRSTQQQIHPENIKNLEILPKGCLIPEDERSQQEFLLSAQFFDSSGSLKLEISNIMEQLPLGSNVKLLHAEAIPPYFLENLVSQYPHLNIHPLPLPVSPQSFFEEMSFLQDLVFATGSRDSKGRFILTESSMDQAVFLKWKNSPANDDPSRTGGFLRFIGDELIAEQHPDTFKSYQVPFTCSGGDFQITRLPSGETAVIIGTQNIIKSIESIRSVTDPNDYNSFMQLNDFYELYQLILSCLKLVTGVSTVIVVDELEFLREVIANDFVDLKHFYNRSLFFHTDMLAKTANHPNNPQSQLAFCTDLSFKLTSPMFSFESKEKLNGLCRRVQQQFRDLEYRVVRLPCGPFPTLNYTNSVIFTSRQGEKIAMVPQYGIEEDKIAVTVYQKMGFKVKEVDMSPIKDLPYDLQMMTGSVHCRTVVLA